MNRRQMRANRASIKLVPCPRCGARKWATCVYPGGKVSLQPHAARRRAAAEAGVYVP